jgi:hypothetical protein
MEQDYRTRNACRCMLETVRKRLIPALLEDAGPAQRGQIHMTGCVWTLGLIVGSLLILLGSCSLDYEATLGFPLSHSGPSLFSHGFGTVLICVGAALLLAPYLGRPR